MSAWSEKLEAGIKEDECLVYVSYAEITDALTHGRHREATVCTAGVPPNAILVRVENDPESRTVGLVFRDSLFRADLLEVRFSPAPRSTVSYGEIVRRSLPWWRRLMGRSSA